MDAPDSSSRGNRVLSVAVTGYSRYRKSSEGGFTAREPSSSFETLSLAWGAFSPRREILHPSSSGAVALPDVLPGRSRSSGPGLFAPAATIVPRFDKKSRGRAKFVQ